MHKGTQKLESPHPYPIHFLHIQRCKCFTVGSWTIELAVKRVFTLGWVFDLVEIIGVYFSTGSTSHDGGNRLHRRAGTAYAPVRIGPADKENVRAG